MPKYKTEQINIGDKVTYTNKFNQAGFSSGIVTGKLDKSILFVDKNENGSTNKIIIDVSEVEDIILDPVHENKEL
jgi:hypothetical protein